MDDAPSGLNRGTGDQTQAGLYKRIIKGLDKEPAVLAVSRPLVRRWLTTTNSGAYWDLRALSSR